MCYKVGTIYGCLCVVLQVANLTKESEFHWFKEDTEIVPNEKTDLSSGACKLPLAQVTPPHCP